MRVCVIYDCLHPWTVGGEEKWLRQLAGDLAARGHDVTYLTRLQWDTHAPPVIPGVDVVAVSRREPLYDEAGNRRSGPPVRFGIGVFRHLLRHRRAYDVVHTCGFPYFHLPALRLALAGTRTPVFVDWVEIWTRQYWLRYSGRVGGTIGILVQGLCVRLTPRGIAFSRLHADRLLAWGLRSTPMRPGGQAGEQRAVGPSFTPPVQPRIVAAGRQIREKRVDLVVDAAVLARAAEPQLTAVILGDGPEHAALLAATRELDWCEVPGFVSAERLEAELRGATALLHPTEREGFGIVVLEATAVGTPVVLVAGPDNAAAELVVPGVNGELAADASAAAVAAAFLRVVAGGEQLRARTARWYAENAVGLSASHTVGVVEAAYREALAR